jgi:hypothetical protein
MSTSAGAAVGALSAGTVVGAGAAAAVGVDVGVGVDVEVLGDTVRGASSEPVQPAVSASISASEPRMTVLLSEELPGVIGTERSESDSSAP